MKTAECCSPCVFGGLINQVEEAIAAHDRMPDARLHFVSLEGLSQAGTVTEPTGYAVNLDTSANSGTGSIETRMRRKVRRAFAWDQSSFRPPLERAIPFVP